MTGSSIVLGAVLLASCRSAPPSEPRPIEQPQRLVVGAAVEVSGSWPVECKKETSIVGLDRVGKFSERGLDFKLERETRYFDCTTYRLHAKVSCADTCVPDDDDGTFDGHVRMGVRMMKVGVTTVRLETKNLETGEAKTFDKRVEVVLPDSFRTQCMNPTKTWGPCSDGVWVEKPLIRVFAVLDGKNVVTKLLRVNGRPAEEPSGFTTGASLAPLVAPAPVQPGVFEIELSVADKRERLSLEMKSAAAGP